MNRLKNITLFLSFTSLLWIGASAQTIGPEITAAELKAHVKYLASDELEGRGSGTEGNRKAAAYIADQMKKYGLKPAGDNGTYFQNFDFVAAVKLGKANQCVIESKGLPKTQIELKPDVDFRPLGFTTNASVSVALVFVGYGISAPESKYDEYKDLDVNGKIVVALRYGPDGNDMHSDLNKHTSLRNKARVAREKGAKGLIIISGPVDDPDDELIKLSFDQSFASSGIPAISMKRSALEKLIVAGGKALKTMQEEMKKDRQVQSLELAGTSVTLTTDVEYIREKTANIVGYLEGTDQKLKDEVIVVGAHMDHLGYGGPGSGSLTPDVHEIHNGADDKASGSASLLELEQAFATGAKSLKRSLVFTAFSGEELGTLGSSYYVNHPFFPLEKTITMVNLDMVGRLENNSLTIYGTGTSPKWNDLISRLNKDSTFTLKLVSDGVGPSDHSQFYAKDIPVLFFFTGTHNDYHKPSDDWDKINYDGEKKVTQFIYSIVKDLDADEAKPAFARTASTASAGGDSRGFNVTLGIVPDYGETKDGMKIGSTRSGGPAEKAGLKAGDVIVMMGGKKVLNIYDYMGLLGELKAEEEVDVEVMRDGKSVKVKATMEKRR
ncbi:MAG: putative aminopeptidase [Bacteroidetes bacterium]|nr:putative aminopeptidase [Bacteroidota bacterium]